MNRKINNQEKQTDGDKKKSEIKKMKIDHKNDFSTDLGAEKNVISKTVQN